MVRIRTWLPSTVALASLALTGCVAHAPPSNQETELRVVSYNILVDFQGSSWKKRGPTVARVLRSCDADLIGIQEASELQVAQLQQQLPDHDCFVGDRSDGHRNDQRWYEFVPIFYLRDRFELLDKSSLWLSESPSRPGSTFKDSKFHGRCLTWVRLKDKQSGRIVIMVNTHTHGRQADKAVRLIQATIHKIAGTSSVILTGDFNFTPDSIAHEIMIQPGSGAGQRLRDAHTIAASRKGPSATHSSDRRIDYIFVGGEPSVSSYRVIDAKTEAGTNPSDHRAVTANIMWR